MATAVIVDALRTPGGKRFGKLSGWHPVDLAGEVLRNLVERLMLLATEDQVDLATVELAMPESRNSGGRASSLLPAGPLAARVEAFEREVILSELKRNHSNVSLAAKSLGLERSHLYKKAEHLGIDLRAMRREQESTPD